MSDGAKHQKLSETGEKSSSVSKPPSVNPKICVALENDEDITNELVAHRVRSINFISSTNKRRYYGVTGYWDFENVGILSQFGGVKKLRSRITAGLKIVNKQFYLYQLIGFGKVRQFTAKDYEVVMNKFNSMKIVQKEPFCQNCNPNIEGESVKRRDKIDSLLKENILLHALDLQPPANIMVLTSDKDFATTISALKERGFTMLVVHPKRLKNTILRDSGTFAWKWEDMTSGLKYYHK